MRCDSGNGRGLREATQNSSVEDFLHFGTEVSPLLFSQVCCCLPACLLAELVEMNLEEAS